MRATISFAVTAAGALSACFNIEEDVKNAIQNASSMSFALTDDGSDNAAATLCVRRGLFGLCDQHFAEPFVCVGGICTHLSFRPGTFFGGGQY